MSKKKKNTNPVFVPSGDDQEKHYKVEKPPEEPKIVSKPEWEGLTGAQIAGKKSWETRRRKSKTENPSDRSEIERAAAAALEGEYVSVSRSAVKKFIRAVIEEDPKGIRDFAAELMGSLEE